VAEAAAPLIVDACTGGDHALLDLDHGDAKRARASSDARDAGHVCDAEVTIAVLVPLRLQPGQNREEDLKLMYNHVRRMYGGLDPRTAVIVGQQSWDGHKFSRGRCLNALALLAVAWYPNVERFVLHDVDLLPDAACVAEFAAPLPLDGCGVLALNGYGQYKGCANYIGGICVVSRATFVGANGFDQRFEGWGGEDDALRDAIVQYAAAQAGFSVTTNDVVIKSAAGAGVTDVEMVRKEAATASGEPPPARCADTLAWKMDKAEKRAVCRAAREEMYKLHGLSSAQFCVSDIFRWSGTLIPGAERDDDAKEVRRQIGQPPDGAKPCRRNAMAGFIDFTIVTLELYVTLPPGWHMCVSKTCGRPYYHEARTRTSTYELPDGATVDRAQRPEGALMLSSEKSFVAPRSEDDTGACAHELERVPLKKRRLVVPGDAARHVKNSAPVVDSPVSMASSGNGKAGSGLSKWLTVVGGSDAAAGTSCT
jgi:hypothetical protein